MGFKSFLSAAGHDFVKVLSFLGSDKGQAAIAGVEAGVNVVAGIAGGPGLAAGLVRVESLINLGIKKVLSVEATATAVGAGEGTGPQKQAAVVASISSQAEDFLKSIGVSAPTAAEVQSLATAISGGIVAVLNAIPAPSANTGIVPPAVAA